MEGNLNNILKEYKSVIDKFKMRSNVLNGSGIAWKGGLDKATLENTPYGIGDGLGTTGWCVSASQALLLDDIFQLTLRYRGAKAKLISIDIKEQYYGYCYNGSQNKWHTAILVEDSGIKFVVDITCRQFGDNFIDKDIWDFESWQNMLRSPICKHHITDFEDKPIIIVPLTNNTIRNTDSAVMNISKALKDYTNLDDNDRLLLSDFAVNKMSLLNQKLILGNISKNDFHYIDKLTETLKVMSFRKLEKGYSVISFATKQAAKNWLELTLNKMSLPIYLTVSKNANLSCNASGIDFDDMNREYPMGNEDNTTYILFEFTNVFGVDYFMENTDLLLAYGMNLNVDVNSGVFNAGKLFNPPKNTNTIYVKVG